jgi:uncharacterized membrane protein YtjA (UPF0391 family)
MLSWSFLFLILAVAAALLGFSVLAGTLAFVFRVLLFVFLVLWVVTLFTGRRRAL